MARSRSAPPVMTMAFLPLVSASSRSDGFQSRNSRAVSYEPVRTTASTPSWVTRCRPTSSSGQLHELHDVVGDPGLVELRDQLGRRGHRLGGRLEDDRVAGRERADDAVGRDGVREVPRSGHEHHAEGDAGHAVGSELVERAGAGGRPAGHVDAPRTPRDRPRGRSCPSRGPSPRCVRPRSAAITSAARCSTPAALVGRRVRPRRRRRAGPAPPLRRSPRGRRDERRARPGAASSARWPSTQARLAATVKSVSGSLANGVVGAEHAPFDRSVLGLARDRRDRHGGAATAVSKRALLRAATPATRA